MPDPSQWSLSAPEKLTFEEPVTALDVRVVGGTVNVVGTDGGPARLELSGIDGPPLLVEHEGGTLSVHYEDLGRQGFLKWLGGKWFDRKEWNRSVTLTLTVPTAARVEVGVVGAHTVASGLTGTTRIRGVDGDTVLMGLTGPVDAQTVSGRLEAQSLAGDVSFKSVSGDLTLVDCTSSAVKADTVSGDMVVDLSAPDGGRGPSLGLTSVSGEITIRLPHPVDAEIDAGTTSGEVSCAFENLHVTGQWGARRITGRLGNGRGRLKATTVAGGVALLRRPPAQEEPVTATEGKTL
ncbi:DUF4097 family beta strand repeat-containing protein [Streptomyces sp. NPDC049577]|uniref:DUF4097 family beta strand repeat-containing protein n=1 Tax=Streptomyces sp. NPDC049577 TaxID=3155153 RepID=UPI003437D66C